VPLLRRDLSFFSFSEEKFFTFLKKELCLPGRNEKELSLKKKNFPLEGGRKGKGKIRQIN
jgi:hypothetical protein